MVTEDARAAESQGLIEDVLARMRAQGGRATPARRLLLGALTASREHRSAEELAAEVQAHAPDVNLSTIYRNLDMSLFDTADGCFMNFAYDWAFARPVRKVYYNLTITGLSIFVAVFIGAIELVGLLAQDTSLTGSGWTWIENFNINTAGFVIVGVFIATWIVALSIWHFGKIEKKWDTAAAANATVND